MTIPLLAPGSIVERFQDLGRAKKSKNRCIEGYKKSNFILSLPVLPQGGTSQDQERPLLPMIFPTRESESKVSTQLP